MTADQAGRIARLLEQSADLRARCGGVVVASRMLRAQAIELATLSRERRWARKPGPRTNFPDLPRAHIED